MLSRPVLQPRGFAFHAAPTLAGSTKGRLILWTVPGSTPNRAAILRTPSVRPGLSKAAPMRFSSSGAIGGLPSRLPSLFALLKAGAHALLNHRALELGKDAHRLE